jgi:hypothetical protein
LFTKRIGTTDTLSAYKIRPGKEEGSPPVNKQQLVVNKQQKEGLPGEAKLPKVHNMDMQ